MPYYQTWEEFARAAEKLYLTDPMKVTQGLPACPRFVYLIGLSLLVIIIIYCVVAFKTRNMPIVPN